LRGTEVLWCYSKVLAKGDWAVLRTESVAGDWNWSYSEIFYWQEAGGFAYAVSEGTIHYLDFASQKWTRAARPKDGRITGITRNPDGSVGIMYSGGIFGSLYFLNDHGKTSEEVSSDFKVKKYPPLRTKSGTVFVRGGMGGIYGKMELHASTDGGRTWQNRGAPNNEHAAMLAMPTTGMFRVSLGQFGLFDIEQSDDEGLTWKVEYSNFDREAYEHQKKKPE
jgi:hypothetical protein